MVILMTRLLLTLLVTCSACTATWGAEHSRTIHAANATTAVFAAATTALDWCGTRHAANTRTDEWEQGMPTTKIIGTSPSPHAVDAYFAISAVALAAAAQLVPERYRWMVYGAITGVEAYTVAGNVSSTRCGSFGSY